MSFLIGLGVFGILTTVTIIIIVLGTQGLFNLNKDTNPLLPQPNCGISSIQPLINQRIIRGENAIPNSYPWMVGLRAAKYSKTHFCGGSLIFPDIVLTAAHCVYGLKPDDILVAVGTHLINETLDETNSFNVTNIKYHEFYTNLLKNDDIALIKLDRQVKLGEKSALVCLPSLKDDVKNILDKNVILTGWGSTNGINSEKYGGYNLQQTILKIIKNEKVCRDNFPFYNDKKMYCAIDTSNVNNKTNICYGDSGGPLIYKQNDKWTLYGLTSLVLVTQNDTIRQCDPTKPSYFTSTTGYLDWIAKNSQIL